MSSEQQSCVEAKVSLDTLKLALEALDMVKTNADDWQERTGKEIKGWMQPVNNSITALRQAIEQAQPSRSDIKQEPVAVKHMMEWVDYLKRKSDYGQHLQIPSGMSAGACWDLARELEQLINKSPPQRPAAEGEDIRKPLTDEQIMAIGRELGVKCRLGGNPRIDFDYARAIEAAHGIMSLQDGKE
jgi:hypothetical protein